MPESPGDPVRVESVRQLDPATTAAVHELVDVVTEADGLRPLDEHVLLHLRHGGDPHAHHVLGWQVLPHGGERLAGYAHLDTTDEVAGPIAEVVVRPDARRHGIGRRMVDALVRLSPDGRLRLWAHGENAASAQLADSMGFARSRVLWQMRRSLSAALPGLRLPEGMRIRAFVPGQDEAAWLEVNGRAFAHHPDQGRWTRADLDLRLAEPWFDPAGFLLAVTEGPDGRERIAGFHWTKVHGEVDGHLHHRIGEVFIVGVDPDFQRHGLGRLLTIAGLLHLRGLGLNEAMLYVDAVNTNAIRVYESLGFVRWDTDVLFTR